MSRTILDIAIDVLKADKTEVKTAPKNKLKEIIDLLDSDKKKLDKASGKLFEVLAGLIVGDLFGVAGSKEDSEAGKKLADRFLDENSQKHLFKAFMEKSFNVASIAPVGDTEKENKCFNPLKSTWESCGDSKTPKKRLRSLGVGRQKERKTGGRVRGANQGKRGGKVTV